MTRSITRPEQATALDKSDPYIDWWSLAEGSRKADDGGRELFSTQGIKRATFGLQEGLSSPDFELPLPSGAKNDKFLPEKWSTWEADASDYPHIQAGDIILGIIDTNFALGQRNFRFASGESRILAAWLQGAETDGRDAWPFGREYSTLQIENALRKHSGGNLNTPLDQEAFHRCLGLVNANRTVWEGSKELQSRASHGTHMLDLAGGITPGELGASLEGNGARCHLIAIALPPLFFLGHGANFLQYHAVLGLLRIFHLADTISNAKRIAGEKGFDESHKFPVVVNFSFSFEAGPKDGKLDMERAIDLAVKTREQRTVGAPTRRNGCAELSTFVNMPAGNSNLARVASRMEFGPGKTEALEFIVQPNDHSSNYIELWSQTIDAQERPFQDVSLTIQLPDGTNRKVPLSSPLNGSLKHVNLVSASGKSLIGRVYFGVFDRERGIRLRIVVALAPTLVYYPMGSDNVSVGLAPAGRYCLDVSGLNSVMQFDGYVQADLFDGTLFQNTRRAYFDHRTYEHFEENGKIRDSFAYGEAKLPRDVGPVRRVGTHNALATTSYVSMIGGYRNSDGQPATYSATGTSITGNGKSDVDVLMPCEDGVAHFGILAAGPTDGSAIALNGTSVATALASRRLVDELLLVDERLKGTAILQRNGAAWLSAEATNYKASRPAHFFNVAPLKGGAGHLPYPDSYPQVAAGLGLRKRRLYY